MSLSHYQHRQIRRIEASLRRCQRAAAGRVRVPRRRPVLAVPANEHSGCARGMLGPILVLGAGFGLLFVPLHLAGLHRVRDKESGITSSLLNAGQQVGSSIGLPVPGTLGYVIYGLIAVFLVLIPNALAFWFAADVPVPSLYRTIAHLERRWRPAAMVIVAGLAVLAFHLVFFPWPDVFLRG